jgi:hypothetical protein
MTSIRILRLLGLLVGLAIALTAADAGHYQSPERRLGRLAVFDNKGYFGNVGLDGDRFVALRFRQGDGIPRPRNFKSTIADTLEVDDKYLGYDLRGKNKNVLVREEWRRQSRQEIKEEFKRTGRPVQVDIRQDICWEFVSSEAKSPFSGYLRVKNGELKGWWIGLGPLEPAKKESDFLWEQYPHAPLVLVKDKKDAAGIRSTTGLDEWSP